MTAGTPEPSRGDIWQVTLDPTLGHEQAGIRPALIVSVDQFNHGPAGLLVVLPITTTDRKIASHVHLPKGSVGLPEDSWIKCEDIRSISKQRLLRYRGSVSHPTLNRATSIIKILLGIR